MTTAAYDQRTYHAVTTAMVRGSLFRAGYGKSITLLGRRRMTIRVQCDVFRLHLDRDDAAGCFYPDLAPYIVAALAHWKSAA